MTKFWRRIYIVLTAPVEVLGCAIVGAWRYGRDGWFNVIDAWAETSLHHRGRE
jgi:hypothetical protein